MNWLYKLSYTAGIIIALTGIVSVILSFLIPEKYSASLITGIILIITGVIIFAVNHYFYKMFRDFPKPEGFDLTLKGSTKMMSTATDYLKEYNRINKLGNTGKPVRVKIISVTDTGQTVQNEAVVNFNVEVLHEKRYENYIISDYKQLVSRIIIPRIQPGNEYSAKVDPKNKNDIYISWI